jgi:hypothetical protein
MMFGNLFGLGLDDWDMMEVRAAIKEEYKDRVKVTRCVGCYGVYCYDVKDSCMRFKPRHKEEEPIIVVGLRHFAEERCLCENCADILGLP